jgi:folate-binding protein YgfZ
MGLTALQIHGQGLGAVRTGEYRGATAAARFADPQTELAALREGCGVYDLGFLARLSLTGEDRGRWLNGMVTNNIRDLAVDQGIYAFLLNPQGRILGDLFAYNRGNSILVETDRSQVEKLLATFDHYIIMDDVEVANQSEQMTALGVAGPKARAILQAAGIAVPEMRSLQILEASCTCDCGCVTCTIVRGEDSELESYELWLAPGDVKKTWNALLAAGATPVGFEALELQRIISGIPLYGVDIRERDLPQETEQTRALNFNKGCYVGQEIVERIRSRGAVHRKFAGFTLDPRTVVAPGEKILLGDKEVGEVTTFATLGEEEPCLALGYVRREAGEPGKELVIGNAKAVVARLPFTIPSLAKAG